MLCDAAELVSDHLDKLKSILAKRGESWGFTGSVTEAKAQDFAEVIADHVRGAVEVWRAAYRGTDRLFYIIGDKVVVTQVTGEFESAWQATPEQLGHYRTGVRIK